MRARQFHDSDADLSEIQSRTVAVIGYGNQGDAQAHNLRDSGIDVIIGNRRDLYRDAAVKDGFAVRDIAAAAHDAQITVLLIPDEVQPEVVSTHVAPNTQAGDTVVVASGYNLAFGLLPLPKDIDVVMVAPRMIGAAVRNRFRDGTGYPCFVSAEQDHSGHALRTALAIARGIGATSVGAVLSSAREEAALDLFSEQSIWPAVFSIFQAGYEVLTEAGFSDDAILDEMYLSKEPAEVLARAADIGLIEQLHMHSRTSQYGQLTTLARATSLTDVLRTRFSDVLHNAILSGTFARDWASASAAPGDPLPALFAQVRTHPLLAAEKEVRSRPDAGS